jgi:hypothetical protein
MNVVVIGNGPSLLGRKLGKVIDSHDVIVRFNFFKTGQFAEDVGKRTTIWFNNRDASPPTIRVMLNEHRFEEIHLHTWVKTEQAVNSFREVLAETGLETPVYGVEKSVISEMREFLGLPYSFFSTGAIGAWMMLKKHAKIKLTGFDWWDSPARMHYFQDREPFPDPSKGHQPMTEKIFFEKLVEMGRIEFI